LKNPFKAILLSPSSKKLSLHACMGKNQEVLQEFQGGNTVKTRNETKRNVIHFKN